MREDGLREVEPVLQVDPAELFGARLPVLSGAGAPAGRQLRALAEWMRRAQPRWRVLSPFVRFDPQSYVRETLFRSPDWELVLLCWGPEHASRIHDHGGSSGVARVLWGEAQEQRFLRSGPGHAVPSARVSLQEGGVLVEASATVHQLRNVSREPALTLHLYSPPLAGMQQYLPAPH
ncbi:MULTISPECIES: cysteine dioxygenase family protein [Myxococcaceae]|uniref:cysteine dioxygenase n=1 Tax=Myxococcaceae TaxID=31 RepID=UPI00188E5F1B|nr:MULTISPECIES: cysteine dioxygenase family protein [Myxococcaceae]MBF5045817.1 cysteine dioxygenase family protein [Simulacricoccus sp. 17bor-14]